MKQPTHTKRSKRGGRWRVRDLIDLEYFLSMDAGPGESDKSASPTSTPRDIYLARLRQLEDDGSATARRRLIKGWLAIRRETEDGPLPGSVYIEAGRIALIVAVLLGLSAGVGLALSLLDYRGEQPLNVAVFMGAAVFSQILLLMIWAAVFFFRTASRSLVSGSVLVKLLGRMLAGAVLRARQRSLETLDGRKRQALAAAAGLLRGRKQIYGSLFFWPIFICVQAFAVCFNIGLLGATLVKLSGSDVAFGWQSTFQVSGRAVFHLVETIALPWRWWAPQSLAYPSLDAIEGSRMILKEGIHALATGNLVSWWPFLCFSVLFYGFLPRLVLLISGIFVQRRLLARLPFDHVGAEALVRKMTSPVLSTAGAPVAVPGPVPNSEREPPFEEMESSRGGGDFVALVPEEIFEACGGLADVAARGLAMRVTAQKMIGAGTSQDRAVLDALEAMRETPGFDGVLVLQEAWQPPIQEMLHFLKMLRRRLGERAGIVVGLVGKPGPGGVFTPPREEDRRIWKRRIDALGDPHLGVERLVSHER